MRVFQLLSVFEAWFYSFQYPPVDITANPRWKRDVGVSKRKSKTKRGQVVPPKRRWVESHISKNLSGCWYLTNAPAILLGVSYKVPTDCKAVLQKKSKIFNIQFNFETSVCTRYDYPYLSFTVRPAKHGSYLIVCRLINYGCKIKSTVFSF